MSPEAVAFSNSIRCDRCGHVASGYLQVGPDGTGHGTCSRCGSPVIQKLEPGYIPQVPAQPYHAHPDRAPDASRYPGLYSQPRAEPRFDVRGLLTLPFRPNRALTTLYLTTSLTHAMVVVLVFVVIHAVLGTAITADMSEVIGFGSVNAFEAFMLAILGCVVSLVSFLVFSVVTSVVAMELFGGRGEKGATVTLVGYCYPWFVFVSLVLMLIFAVGFEGLELSQVTHWSDAEVDKAIVWGVALLAAAIMGLIWLLFIAGKAIGVANDISTGEGAMSALIGCIAAGVVSLLIGTVIRLPIGLAL